MIIPYSSDTKTSKSLKLTIKKQLSRVKATSLLGSTQRRARLTSPTEPPAPPEVPVVAASAVAPEAVVHRVEVGTAAVAPSAAAAPERVVAVAAAVDDVARRGPERHGGLVGHVDGLLVHEAA